MPKYFIQNGKCGTEAAFKIIGAKWKPHIIYLCNENNDMTFSKLKQNLTGITDATLTRQVHCLIDDGILQKYFTDLSKTKPFFILTDKAKDLLPAMQLMQQLSLLCGYQESEHKSQIEYAHKLIGSKWKSRIIWILHHYGTIRFNELQNSIEGISHKVLTGQLKQLLEQQLVLKTDYNEKSPHVEYSLTSAGELAYQIVQALADWCLKYELIKPHITINY